MPEKDIQVMKPVKASIEIDAPVRLRRVLGHMKEELSEEIENGKYPSSFYRVSVKAVVRDDRGEILGVKEHFDGWALPGGGLEFGESVRECLRRELKEELNIENDFVETPSFSRTIYIPKWEFWKLNLFYDVEIVGDLEFSAGEGIGAAGFVPLTVEELYANEERYLKSR